MTDETTQAVIKAPPKLPDTYDNMEVLAESTVKSGFYKDVKTKEQALAKMMYGQALGFSPAFAMQKLLVVNEQVTMMGEAVLAKWKDEDIRWYRFFYNKAGENIAEATTKDKKLFGCGLLLWDKKGKLLTVGMNGETAEATTFDLDRAAQAGLLNKDNWRKYPDRMLFYRAVAFAARDYTPGLMQGLLTTEEAQDIAYTKVVKVTVPEGASGPSSDQQQGEECPIHAGTFFTENKWHQWTHATDEKNDKGKTIWCYKDKVTTDSPQTEPVPTPAAPQQQNDKDDGVTMDWSKVDQAEYFKELDRIILDKGLSAKRIKEIMEPFGYSKRTEITIAKRIEVLMALLQA